jgi:hypothetical protein
MNKITQKTQKFSDSFSKSFNKTYNDSQIDILFSDKTINYSVLAILIITAGLLMPNLSVNSLSLFDNLFFKIFFLILIALVAYKDPVMSLLLAIIFIIAIQRLHNNKLNTISSVKATADYNNSNLNSNYNSNINPYDSKNYSNPIKDNSKLLDDNLDLIDNNKDDNDYNLVSNPDYSNQSSSSSSNDIHINDVIDDQIYEIEPDTRFTNENQFLNAQSNIIPQSSYMSQIKTFENQFGTQGLEDDIQGFSCNGSNTLTYVSSAF